ncbi:MAG: enoyl-CoA hydratase/isomerase family protein, partial [Haladaptatus sp.]
RMGLVSRLTETPRAVADELAENVPAALSVVKERVRDGSSTDIQLASEAEAFGELVAANADSIAEERE